MLGHGFGLGKVHLAVQEGTTGKLAGFGQTGTQIKTAGEQQLHDDRAAMAVQLDDVFAGD